MTGVLLKLKFVISRTSEPGYYAASKMPVLPAAVLESLYEHLPPYNSDMAEQYTCT